MQFPGGLLVVRAIHAEIVSDEALRLTMLRSGLRPTVLRCGRSAEGRGIWLDAEPRRPQHVRVSDAQCYVTLRIAKPGTTASEVTSRLGIEPTHSHEAGDQRVGVDTRFREAMWGLSTEHMGMGRLADHLMVLLDAVESKRQVILDLAGEGYAMDWFCFVGVSTNGGVALAPEMLGRLAALPIRLDLDIYG